MKSLKRQARSRKGRSTLCKRRMISNVSSWFSSTWEEKKEIVEDSKEVPEEKKETVDDKKDLDDDKDDEITQSEEEEPKRKR